MKEILSIVAFLLIMVPGIGQNRNDQQKISSYVKLLEEFGDNVLKYGRDNYGKIHTPLFVDGINIDTREPVTWQRDGKPYIISNFGSQQNLMRSLIGISIVSNNQKYENAANNAVEYTIDHLKFGDLLAWGGHITYDATNDEITYAENKSMSHELKSHYPFYELLWKIDPEFTRKYIENFWNSHVVDWKTLDFSRHGRPRDMGLLWDNEYVGGKVPFPGLGLTFHSSGSDLYYAASLLYEFTGDSKPLLWAKRLASRYADTRHPDTGIGGFLFNTVNAWITGPEHRGDRAEYQYAEKFPGHVVLEATIFPYGGGGHSSKTRHLICKLVLAERLGESGKEFRQWALEELKSLGKIAYRKTDNSFVPMLTDGTSMEGVKAEKPGYFGGSVRRATKLNGLDLWAYTKAFKIDSDDFLWQMIRDISLGLNLGDPGKKPGKRVRLNKKSTSSNPEVILAFLELYNASRYEGYLDFACIVADNMIRERFNKGFFTAGTEYPFAKFDSIEPLVLCHLTAALQGKSHKIPIYPGGHGFFHDGELYDSHIYQKQRSEIISQTQR